MLYAPILSRIGKYEATEAFSLSLGLGFTQVPGIFDIFPDIVKTVFAENCVAIVFVIAIILDRVLPVEKDAV